MNFDLGSGPDRNLNIVSIGFLVAALLTCMITLLILLFGGGGGPERPPLPTQIIVPTSTETPIPTITRTPLPATFTPTFTATFTVQPSTTASPTPTTTTTVSPTPTVTTTALPSATATETETAMPTLGTPPPSPSPFLFAPTDVVFSSNLNASACAWQGIGGQVLDQAGNPSTLNLRISVTGGGLIQPQTAGNNTNSLYGPGGFEVQLTNAPNTQTYFVQLETTIGTPVSDVIRVTFDGTCEGNLALINFSQTRAN